LAEHVTCMREQRNAYRVLIEKPEGKLPLWRPKYGLGHNIKIDLGEIAWGGMDCIQCCHIRNRFHCPDGQRPETSDYNLGHQTYKISQDNHKCGIHCDNYTWCQPRTAKRATIREPLLSNSIANNHVSMAVRGYSNRGCVFYMIHGGHGPPSDWSRETWGLRNLLHRDLSWGKYWWRHNTLNRIDMWCSDL
jgi:hypothetical protein